jgi:hypothetical protein
MRWMLAIILVTMLAAPASAMVLGLDWGSGESPVTFSYLGHNQTVYAGSLKAYLGGTLGNPLPPNDGTYIGEVFCVDLDHTINIPTEYDISWQTTAALANGGRAAWIYQNYLAGSKNANNPVAAAVQIALWDVVYDAGDGLASGNFQYVNGLSATASSQAASLITSSVGHTAESAYFVATGQYGQAMIVPVPVPEAGTAALVGLGLSLLGVGFVRKRS